MKKIHILDCTLRDGGRIIDCKFSDKIISNMDKDLTQAGIDIIEMGFLRGHDLVNYYRNSTFFTEVEQIKPFISKERKKWKTKVYLFLCRAGQLRAVAER